MGETGMRRHAQAFSASVELPCRVFCGPETMLELSGIAVEIDTGSLVLMVERVDGTAFPQVGDRVRVELSLPVNSPAATPKCLIFRALVVRLEQMTGGSWQIGLTFRKPRVIDSAADALKKGVKRAGSGWEM